MLLAGEFSDSGTPAEAGATLARPKSRTFTVPSGLTLMHDAFLVRDT